MDKKTQERVKERAQYACNCFFMIFILAGLVIVILLHLQVFPNVQDTRCKCVCPHNLDSNVTDNRTVFVKIVNEKSECTCRRVIIHLEEVHCAKCTCQFEVRNNLLVKVIIVSMMALVIGLLIYTVVYSIYKCIKYYTNSKTQVGYEHINDEVDAHITLNVNSNSSRFRSNFLRRIAYDRNRGYT